MAHLEKGARNCGEALMKGLLPELTEEELREADQEFVWCRRQARSEGVYPILDSWRCRREVRCGLENVFPSRVHGHCGLDMSHLSGSVIDASLHNLSHLPSRPK